MYCPSCGAFYPGEKEYQCPYCQTENPNLVEKKRDKILKKYDVNQQKLEAEMYDERSKKVSDKIRKVAVGIVITVIILCVAVFSGFLIVKSIAKKTMQKHIGNMEVYLTQEDLEGLQNYMREHDIHGSEYVKYVEVREVYNEYELMLMYYDSIHEFAQKDVIVDIQSDSWSALSEDTEMMLSYAIKAYKFGTPSVDDFTILGNEFYIADALQKIIAILETYGVTEEELAELALDDLGQQDQEKIDELATRILYNMFETK